jgi:hypothetical protein
VRVESEGVELVEGWVIRAGRIRADLLVWLDSLMGHQYFWWKSMLMLELEAMGPAPMFQELLFAWCSKSLLMSSSVLMMWKLLGRFRLKNITS